MHSALLLNLDDFSRYLWHFGDAMLDRASSLTRLIDGDAELDEDYTISLGDIVIACDVEMALIALSLIKNRRATLNVLWPTIQGFIHRSKNENLRAGMKRMKDWIEADETIDLSAVKSACEEVRRDIDAGRLPAVEKEPYTFAGYEITAPTRNISAVLEWCVDYARGDEDRIDNDEYHNSPGYIVDRIMEMYEQDDYHNRNELNKMLTARIVYMSPPLALVGEGHSKGFQP